MPAAAAVRPNGPCTGRTRTTGLEQLRQAGVDIFDGDVTQPVGLGAGSAGLGRQVHQAGDSRLAHRQQGAFHAGHAGIGGVPADHAAVKGLGRSGIGGHQFVPDERIGG